MTPNKKTFRLVDAVTVGVHSISKSEIIPGGSQSRYR